MKGKSNRGVYAELWREIIPLLRCDSTYLKRGFFVVFVHKILHEVNYFREIVKNIYL